MTTKSDYTPQEWELLQKPLLTVGPTVAEAVDSGALGTVMEYGAILDAAITARQQYASNKLLQALLSDAERQGLGKQPGRQRELPNADFNGLKTELLSTCRQAIDLLKHKALLQEVAEYTYVVMNIGTQVAIAAREGGGVLGSGGQRISAAEAAVLKEIGEALGLME